jgi:hypothetical protein
MLKTRAARNEQTLLVDSRKALPAEGFGGSINDRKFEEHKEKMKGNIP